MIPEAVFREFPAGTVRKHTVSGQEMPGIRRKNPVTISHCRILRPGNFFNTQVQKSIQYKNDIILFVLVIEIFSVIHLHLLDKEKHTPQVI